MIQRIQSVYLAIVSILSLVSLFFTIGRYALETGDVVASFTNFTFTAEAAPFTDASGMASPWALSVLLIVAALVNIVCILVFNHRKVQQRLAVFSTLLLFGYVCVYAFYAWGYASALALILPEANVQFAPQLSAIWPVISIILNLLAIRGIRKDEALIQSLNRLR